MAWTGQVRVGDGPPAPASVELADDALTIVPQGSEPVRLPLVDVDDLHDQDYVLRLTDHLGTRYELTMFGRAYGQILGEVRKARDAALERDLLLRGVNLQDSFPGKLFGGPEPVPVEVRLYEDLLVVVPDRGTMFGVPFSSIEGVNWDEELYQVPVRTDEGTLVFGHLAKRTEEFRDELGRLLDALARRTAATLAGLLPGLNPAVLSRLAARMRDGRAVQRREVDAIDPSVWPRLEDAALGTEELRATYERLKAMTVPGWAAFGVKAVLTEQPKEGPPRMDWQSAGDATDRQGRGDWRDARDQAYEGVVALGRQGAEASAEGATGRAGGGTGGSAQEVVAQRAGGERASDGADPSGPPPQGKTTDLWYFCPLALEGRPVNAVAQEVASEGGHATYLFRLADPATWGGLSGEAQAGEVARGIARLNRALLQLNFRREPIYLPEDQIDTGKFGKYRVALRKLPHLRWAREAFLGRAIHNASWESQIRDAADRA